MGTLSASAVTPHRRPRTWRLATVTLAVTLSVLTGCGANFGAQTNQIYQPADGISNRDGEVYAIDLLVVSDGSNNGTVVGTLIDQNPEDDQLTGFAAAGLDGEEITTAPLKAPLDLPSQTSVKVQDGAKLRLAGDAVVPGDFITLTLTFASAAPVEVQVPVHDVGTIYTDIPIKPLKAG